MDYFYAGIGSRQAPPAALDAMERFAYDVHDRLVLRSGAAPGSDTAFEIGADSRACTTNVPVRKEIFLPWKLFNQHNSPLYTSPRGAFLLAKEAHPTFNLLSKAAQQLVARNMCQILGQSLANPVEFVVCWTKDGCEDMESYSRRTGGTGTAICLASALNIPVYNIRNRGRLAAAYAHADTIS